MLNEEVQRMIGELQNIRKMSFCRGIFCKECPLKDKKFCIKLKIVVYKAIKKLKESQK